MMDGSRPVHSASGAALDARSLVMQFESLGGAGHGGEFGLFQRHYDAEPLGLLRWADLAPDLLIKALETRFEGVGLPENTIVFKPDGSDEWWTRDTRFWMAMRSFIKVADVPLERMTIQVCRRLQFLRRKLIEDLAAGEKLFVFKNMWRNLTKTELARLHAAVASYGETTLFYIQYADDAHPAGTVEARAPGLLVGCIEHFGFSPEDKELTPANELFYALCQKAYALHAGLQVTEPPGSVAPMPPRKRRVVVIGNCQAQAMVGLYSKFVAGRTGDILTHVATYQDLTVEARASIEQADLIVEQLFDLRQQADTAGIASGVPRLFIPMVTAAFLWPFAGQAHPRNADYPFLTGGPYGAEASDSYLNRLILAGTDPEEAVETYMRLDVMTRTNLDRMHELIMDRQRARDEAADYKMADVIERYFRTESVFLTPYHPNTRVAVALATRFFQQMGADRSDIERMQGCIRVTPFPKGELPLHPSVCRHFGLDFVTSDRRYRFMNEGLFTVRQYALRYMRYEWNETLEQGMSLAHAGKFEEAHDKLVAGITRSPNSAAAHNALSHVLGHQNRLNDAVAAVSQALEIEPDCASYRANLGVLLQRLGRLDAAETELRAAVAADPVEPHNHILLAHLLRRRGKTEEAVSLVRAALVLDPYSAKLHEELADLLEALGDLAGAVQSQQQAISLAPDSSKGLRRMTHLLARAGRVDEAVEVARSAMKLDPQAVPVRVLLSDVLLRAGKPQEALTEALMAAVIDPDSADAYSHLGHVLLQNGDPAAETALRRAARLNPGNAHVRHQLADVFLAGGRLDEAIAAAQEAAELEPANVNRFAHLARLLLKADKTGEAEVAQRRAVQLAPDDMVLRVALSDLLARRGHREQALDEARLAAQFQPENAQALGHLAHILQMNGDLRQSEVTYRQAIELAPANNHLRVQLAHVQSRLHVLTG